MQLSTHAHRLERWLGADSVEHLSRSMRDWYGPPIAVAGVPGMVWAHRGGDFRGPIASGQFLSAVDFAVMRLKRAMRDSARRQRYVANMAGFASLSDLIAEATAGKMRRWYYQKAGTTGVVGVTNSLWKVGTQPVAGANASAAPGGDAPTDATQGAVLFDNVSPDTRHVVSAWAMASVINNTLLMYDRIFQVNKTMSSTGTEAVTGVPTRYQSTTPGAADSAEGNFLFVEVGVALGATAHNWTVCQYADEAAGASTLPSLTGAASAIINRLDHPAYQWFAPLASGDTGVQKLTQMQCSASVTGTINFVIGHPLCWIPCPIANLVCQADYVNTAFNLTRVFDDAAVALLEVQKPATGATSYAAELTTVAG
jgi:hypothetical protein